jgi:hypothetical protein
MPRKAGPGRTSDAQQGSDERARAKKETVIKARHKRNFVSGGTRQSPVNVGIAGQKKADKKLRQKATRGAAQVEAQVVARKLTHSGNGKSGCAVKTPGVTTLGDYWVTYFHNTRTPPPLDTGPLECIISEEVGNETETTPLRSSSLRGPKVPAGEGIYVSDLEDGMGWSLSKS